MNIITLSEENVDLYLKYCQEALVTDEAETLVYDHASETEVLTFLRDPFYKNTKNLLAMEDGKVVGQLEYHFYGVLADNYRMAYVDWVHTLKSYRKRGVAKALFKQFEEDCRRNRINQYYLIQSGVAQEFYNHFSNASFSQDRILRKDIC